MHTQFIFLLTVTTQEYHNKISLSKFYKEHVRCRFNLLPTVYGILYDFALPSMNLNNPIYFRRQSVKTWHLFCLSEYPNIEYVDEHYNENARKWHQGNDDMLLSIFYRNLNGSHVTYFLQWCSVNLVRGKTMLYWRFATQISP